METSENEAWSRAIILVDMNAFFASVEQLDDPRLRNKPVVVTNGTKGSCIITASYEARAFGIKTGMRLQEARKHCAQLDSMSLPTITLQRSLMHNYDRTRKCHARH